MTLLLAWCAPSALAADPPRIAVVGLHDASLEPAAQREAAQGIAEQLRADGRLQPLSLEEVARALAGREQAVLAEAVAGPGRRLLEDGRTFHDQAQPEEAILVLESAVVELEASMQVVDTSRDLWRALLYLGASHFALEDLQAAEQAWRRAVALIPERQPDASKVPPGVVSAYREAQRSARQEVGELKVNARGADSLRLNGREIGKDSTRLEGVVAGRHHLYARGSGALAAYATVEVAPGETSEIILDLEPARLGVPGRSPIAQARQTTELYRALGVPLSVDLVLIGGSTDQQGELQLYAPAADTFSERVSFSIEPEGRDGLAQALPRLLGRLDANGRLSAGAGVPFAAPLDPSSNRLLTSLLLDPKAPEMPPAAKRKRWPFVAAGAVGAIVVGGVISAVAFSRGGDRGKIIVGPVP